MPLSTWDSAPQQGLQSVNAINAKIRKDDPLSLKDLSRYIGGAQNGEKKCHAKMNKS